MAFLLHSGHAHVVESLLNDIDVEETDYDGWNALLNAAHQGHAAVVRVLLDVGKASIDQPDYMGWTPLMWACYKDRYEGAVFRLSKVFFQDIICFNCLFFSQYIFKYFLFETNSYNKI